jgi:hypothetical protein
LAEIGDIASIVLVGKNQAYGVPMLLQCMVRALNPRLKFFQWGHVLAVDGGCVLQNPENFLHVSAVPFKRWSRVHCIRPYMPGFYY